VEESVDQRADHPHPNTNHVPRQIHPRLQLDRQL